MTSSTVDEILERQPLADLAALRLIASGRRHAIVQALTPRSMTAKELAQTLGTVPTKLYYHLNLLESAGIIRIAGERVVSGIVERSYRAVARTFVVDRTLLSASAGEVADVQAVILDETAQEYRTRGRHTADASSIEPLIGRSYFRCRPEKLRAFRKQLSEIIAAADGSDEDAGDTACLTVALFSYDSTEDTP
jgi:hypothetical protein